MLEVTAIIYAKFKMFFAGILTGAVFHYFEIQVGRAKFNIGKFITSLFIFGLLTQFSSLFIEGNFLQTNTENEARVMVVSIMLASFLYLFIPYVLREDNRSKFIESVLFKFGFTKETYVKKK